jgi:Ca2+/Na+ antiporter
MTFLADVIFPAFYFPYFVAVAYPLSGLAALATEIFIFRRFYPSAKLSWLIAVVVGANVASSLLGIGIASVLPSGLNSAWVQGRGGPARGLNWSRLALISWFVALILSILVEYFVLLVVTRRKPLPRLARAVAIANIASYAVLVVVLQLSIYVAWHR